MNNSLKAMILFAVVALLTACGGSGNPSDVSLDTADVASADIQDLDTVQPDGVVRDVDDVVADVPPVDVAVDTLPLDVVGDIPALDVVADVEIDIPTGDVTDQDVCVPDCSGGACTDDGCGGDCCDEGTVCDPGWPVSGTLCLPVSGVTCAEVRDCLDTCDTQVCAISCYNSGSEAGRAALYAITVCVETTCDPSDQGCMELAWAGAGECNAEFLACKYDGCVSDCSGGACTDDGCGGDCCAPEGSCLEPFGGGALVCLSVLGTTCTTVIECINNCADNECAEACLNAGSEAAQAAFDAILDCLDLNCAGQGEQCVQDAIALDGACHEDMNNCLAN